MTLESPIPFRQALSMLGQKKFLRNEMSSDELTRLSADLRERSFFSARVTNAEFLQRGRDVIATALNPVTATRPDGTTYTAGIDLPSARLALKQYLQSISYQPSAPEEEGTIKDLRTDARLNVILNTNIEMMQGYGAWAQGQEVAILDQWPAQELFRAEERKERRNWHERVKAAAAESGSDIYLVGAEGVVALKNDPFWEALSAFGLPYPPFDFGSGMWVRDVSRPDAMGMGLIDRDTQIEPQTRGVNDDVEVQADKFDAAILRALREEPDLEYGDGALRLRPNRLATADATTN